MIAELSAPKDVRSHFLPSTQVLIVRIADIKTIQDYEITTICAPPTAFRQLVLKENLDLLLKKKPKALEHCVYVFPTVDERSSKIRFI